ncbi:MAG: MATE family efflux transporter [Flavobacteriales bacterium]|nr:MAG: MATE family efflux transporter [Flavobacteriales bacterium]
MNLSNYTKEFSYNLKLSIPVILGLVGHTLVGMIDNIMVGNLDPINLAAVSLGNSYIFIAMSIGIGFSAAITPIVAEAHSEGNQNKLKKSFINGFILCLILGTVLYALVLVLKNTLVYLDQPVEVVKLALPYIDIVAISLIPLLLFQALKQYTDGLSRTIYPMYATVVANIINVIINYILIFGMLGFPKLGIIGAAIGTLISRIIMFAVLFYMLMDKKIIYNYMSDLKSFIYDKFMIKEILSLGFPTSLQMFFEVGLFTTAIWLSGLLGEIPQSANQIVLNISSMTFMVASGLSVSAAVRAGNQKGLKNYQELKRISLSILLLGIYFASFFALGIYILRDYLPYIYIDINNQENLIENIELVKIASKLFIIVAIFQLFDSAQVIILGTLRGMQDVKIPTVIVFIAYWIVGFPISFILGDESSMAETGIWIGLLCGLLFSSVFLYWRFLYLTNKMINK